MIVGTSIENFGSIEQCELLTHMLLSLGCFCGQYFIVSGWPWDQNSCGQLRNKTVFIEFFVLPESSVSANIINCCPAANFKNMFYDNCINSCGLSSCLIFIIN